MTPQDVVTWLDSQERRPRRAEVAARYHDLIVEYWNHSSDCDWSTLNIAIMNRWSPNGLVWIKTEAWRAAEKTVRRLNAEAR